MLAPCILVVPWKGTVNSSRPKLLLAIPGGTLTVVLSDLQHTAQIMTSSLRMGMLSVPLIKTSSCVRSPLDMVRERDARVWVCVLPSLLVTDLLYYSYSTRP